MSLSASALIVLEKAHVDEGGPLGSLVPKHLDKG